MKFKRVFQKSVFHNEKPNTETLCETEFILPHEYPLSTLTLRTWRFHSLPTDLKIESRGCRLSAFTRVESALVEGDFSMPETHIHYTEFRPISDGFVSVTSGGITARATWRKKNNGDFIISDFEGRKAIISKLSIKEIISDEELKQWQANHNYALETLDILKSKTLNH